MLLTVTTTHRPATDLGYLLHKNPARAQEVELAFGRAHVFYPEADEERCTAALLLEVDPVELVRGRATRLSQYVNDRPYVASSFLSVAISRVFGTALGGRSKERQALAEIPIPLRARLAVVAARGGEPLLRRLFEPLGYEVGVRRHPLDEVFPEWGESRYYDLTLEAVTRLADLLAHLYVLVPVLDDDKHYWVGRDEIDKLLRRGEDWLSAHPERDLIVRRYLRHQRALTREALARLSDDEDALPDDEAAADAAREEALETPIRLHDQRLDAVVEELARSGALHVVDLGCGDGRLLRHLLDDRRFERILGVDVSCHALAAARRRLRLDRLPEHQRGRLTLVQGALTYRDRRLEGFDAAALVEVVEHLDPPRLEAFERVVFEHARPATVVLTTPNVEYNVHFPGLSPGALRHPDHRFEWTRDEFRSWVVEVAERYGYTVRITGIGEAREDAGAPSQMGVFRRVE